MHVRRAEPSEPGADRIAHCLRSSFGVEWTRFLNSHNDHDECNDTKYLHVQVAACHTGDLSWPCSICCARETRLMQILLCVSNSFGPSIVFVRLSFLARLHGCSSSLSVDLLLLPSLVRLPSGWFVASTVLVCRLLQPIASIPFDPCTASVSILASPALIRHSQHECNA